MADTYTSTTSNASTLIATALDLKVRYFLSQMPQFRQYVDVRPIQPSHDGPTVTLTIHGQQTEATTPLSETVDVDARDIPAARQVSVTMAEYGDANNHTLRAETFDWSNELAGTISMQLADSMVMTMDTLVRTKLDAASNLWYNDTGVGYTAASPADGGLDALNAAGISSAVAALRSKRAIPKDGNSYVAIIHPHVAHDVRREAGANSWITPHGYVDTGEIYAGETGMYAGARIIEHNRARIQTAQGSGSRTQYTNYFLAREAIMECVAIEPHAVVGLKVDKLQRLTPIGWHGLLGWSLFRQNCIQLIKTESSLGTLVDLSSYDAKA